MRTLDRTGLLQCSCVVLLSACGPSTMTIQMGAGSGQLTASRCVSSDEAASPPACEFGGAELPNRDPPYARVHSDPPGDHECRVGEITRIVITDMNTDHPVVYAFCPARDTDGDSVGAADATAAQE